MASNPAVFSQQSDLRPLAGESHCPWCDQAIPHDKFDAIHARIQARERERLAEEERRLRQQAEQQKAQFEAKAKAEIEAAQRLAAETAAKSKVDVEMAKKLAVEEVAKVKAQAEATARVQVEAEKRAAAAAIETARNESTAKARAELQQEQQAAQKAKADADAAQHQALAARAEAEAAKKKAVEEAAKAQAEAEAAKKMAAEQTAKVRADAEKAAEATIAARVAAAEQAASEAKQQKEQLQAAHNAEIAAQRTALEKDTAERVNAERSKAFEANLKLQQEIEDLHRKAQHKSPQELGEGAELDLFEELKAAYPDDLIMRIGPGAAGADIRHHVRHNGQVCGTILYDSKDRSQWRTDYAKKLRTDQVADKADHAVLSTNVFPAGVRQLDVYEGVILACPARILALVVILREHILRVYTLRLSGEERAQKTAQLYEFMTSNRSADLFAQMTSAAEQLEDLDIKERKAHDTVWEKRNQMIRASQKAQATLQVEMERIIGTGPA